MDRSTRWLFLLGLTAIPATGWGAESAADILMKSVKPAAPSESSASATAPLVTASMLEGIQLKDPFSVFLFSAWQTEPKLPYEVNLWVLKVLRNDAAGAAHLWSVIEPKLPSSFEAAGQAAQLYCLWKLGIPQTFLDAWVQRLETKSFLESSASTALQQTVGEGLDRWLWAEAVQLSPEQEKTIRSLDPSRSLAFATLQAWTYLRAGEAAIPVLERLPAAHALRVPLARAAILGLARKNELGAAGKLMKSVLEPAIERGKDPRALSRHYLEVARLLYQAGVLDAAEKFYEKIPNGLPEFLTAREELTWVWLRTGDVQRLRGEMATLDTGAVELQFYPDLYVVRGVSNLKLCFYNEVEKDLARFIEKNTVWAKDITAALAASDPAPPSELDSFSELAVVRLAKRQAEAKELERLVEHSITAVLPAVGPQSHWVRARERSLVAVETAKKARAEEFRRQWRNRRQVLAEAIRKMQFIKVELMSQVQLLSKPGTPSAQRGFEESQTLSVAKAEALKVAPGEIAFPFDGVVWSDELFKIRSVAQAKCLEARK